MQKFASKKKVNHGFPFAQKTITPKEPWRQGGREREKKGEQFSKFQKHGLDQRTIHEKSSNELKAS